MKEKKLNADSAGNVIINVFMALVIVLALYPIWYTVVVSFNNSEDTLRGGIYWLPRQFTFESYKMVFQDRSILNAFVVTILKTVIGTVVSVFFTAMVGYAFSKKHIMGNRVYNMIIFMSFFRELPAGLEESAKLDGANDFTIFIKLIFPLSMPVVATIALFNGVAQWNDYFTGVMYINDAAKQPIQTFLYRIIASASASKAVVSMPAGISVQQVSSQSVRLATMVVTTLPIVCVYPFLQKYFVKGMLIGSIKG